MTTEDSQKSKQFQLSLRSDYIRFQSKTQIHSDRARSSLPSMGEELKAKAASLKSHEEEVEKSKIIASSQSQTVEAYLVSVTGDPIPGKKIRR